MTRVMLDALYPFGIPQAQDPAVIIAAYVGHSGNINSLAQATARFPGHQIVSIASHNAVDAQVLDVERGAVDPSDYQKMRTWILRQKMRGVMPTIYCNTSTWPSLPVDIRADVNWWAAGWSAGPHIPTGAVGIQYDGKAGYDISVMADYITGIDPPLAGPAGHGSEIEDPDMNADQDAALHRLDSALGSPTGTLWAAINRIEIAENVAAALAGNGADVDVQPLVDAINRLPAEVLAELVAKLTAPTPAA